VEDFLRLRTRTGQDRPVCEQAAPGLLTATAARLERSRRVHPGPPAPRQRAPSPGAATDNQTRRKATP
jgi:hypothetical protein